MTTLILPVAGKSSRFKGLRPKWLLTMPDGKLLIEKSIRDINLNDVNKIVIICLKNILINMLIRMNLLSYFQM